MNKMLTGKDLMKLKNSFDHIKIYGPIDSWVLLSAFEDNSYNDNWASITKAMEIKGVGCLVRLSKQRMDHISVSMCFVPGVKIKELDEGAMLVPIS